jgi:ubiquinone/menaquinone biosynthesis C-methylase UbiE
MPNLESPLHLDMLRRSSTLSRSLPARILSAIRNEIRSNGGVYGMEWGDPDTWDPLTFIRDHYVLPYVQYDQVAVEIGPGGGRWTKYLLGFGKIYAVDYHNELLCELKKRYGKQKNIEFIKNNGTDFPGVAAASVNYLFSFGTFVHLDFNIIEAYLDNIRSVLRPGANAVVQYSDKTKVMARRLGDGFTDNNPDRMRAAVQCRGYTILQEDTTTLWHSSVIRFTI